MGEPKNPHFHDFGIFERRQASKPILFIFVSLEAPGYLKQTKKNPWYIFENIIFIHLEMSKTPEMSTFEKTRAGK